MKNDLANRLTEETLSSMAKKSRKRRRSTSEKIMIILGILIALSMMLSLFVGLGSSRRGQGNAPLPESERFDLEYEGAGEPISALDPGTVEQVAAIPVGAIAPPLS